MRRFQPRLPMQDGGAWFAVCLLAAVGVTLLLNARMPPVVSIFFIVLLALMWVVLLVLILRRGRRDRRAATEAAARTGAACQVLIYGGEELVASGDHARVLTSGWITRVAEEITLWAVTAQGPAKQVSPISIDSIRSLEVERHFACYPSLLIEYRDERVLRLGLAKPKGLAWRLGATQREADLALGLMLGAGQRH